MKNIPQFWLAALLIAAAPAQAQQSPSPNGAEDEVRTVARGFAAALSSGDSIAALGYLHDEVRILEGARAETKEQYRSGHLSADIRYASSVQSETLREGVTLTGEVALYTRQYRVTGTSGRGALIDRTSSEAMVLVRTPTGWQIRDVHWF